MTCPVCGYQFTEFKHVCDGCLFHNGCKLVCCPNCHYQFPEESKTVTFLTKIFKKEKINGTTRD